MIKIPKKWRELPKEDRLNIPQKCFKIDKEIIQKIRNQSSPKEKLIKLQKSNMIYLKIFTLILLFG